LVREVQGDALALQTRTGAVVSVDLAAARKAGHAGTAIHPGSAMLVRGDYDRSGVLHAQAVVRVKSSPALWRADQ
jgi:hypothetical protein